jgi:hypothetical protein
MAFCSWCACQSSRIALQTEALYQSLLRRRICKEHELYRARLRIQGYPW